MKPILHAPPAHRLPDDEMSRHDGESDRRLQLVEHPNLERPGAQPHPALARRASPLRRRSPREHAR